MKKVLLVTILAAANCFGVAGKELKATPSAPITTAYATSAVQLASELGTMNRHLIINNTTLSQIACYATHNDVGTTPTDNTTSTFSEAIKVPASTAYVLDLFNAEHNIYCRSDSGSNITSGSIMLQVW